MAKGQKILRKRFIEKKRVEGVEGQRSVRLYSGLTKHFVQVYIRMRKETVWGKKYAVCSCALNS